MAVDDDELDGAATASFEVEPSALDEATHAECLVLFRDCEHNIRFSKGLQWRTVVASIGIFVLLTIAGYRSIHQDLTLKIFILISVTISAGAIYALSILQSWQNTEREKRERIVKELSNLGRLVDGLRSRTEANIHRYILLLFMVITIIAGNYVAATLMMQLYYR